MPGRVMGIAIGIAAIGLLLHFVIAPVAQELLMRRRIVRRRKAEAKTAERLRKLQERQRRISQPAVWRPDDAA